MLCRAQAEEGDGWWGMHGIAAEVFQSCAEPKLRRVMAGGACMASRLRRSRAVQSPS